MSVIEGVVVGAETGGFYTTEIEQSLRFNDDDSAYLSWTPASAGNRKTWTFSTWVKRGNFVDGTIYSCMSGTTQFRVIFNSDVLRVFSYSGGYQLHLQTSAVYRDTSAWYHITLEIDTTQATSSDRAKLYVNGERVTQFGTAVYPSQNADLYANMAEKTGIGATWDNGASTWTAMHDGYLAETHFIDGTAYDATAFGEFKNGVWIAKAPDVTYGTNGFYLPYRNDYTVEGFSTVTYTGTSSYQYIGGVGFEPDLVWFKSRDGARAHVLIDSVRGVKEALSSGSTDAEYTEGTNNGVMAFNTDGFTIGNDGGYTSYNSNGESTVAWCWDAGTGSPVSNTDGSITSTVKANPSRGFSIVSYVGNGSTGTIGHGLSEAPELIIVKCRDIASNWIVGGSIGPMEYGVNRLVLHDTLALTADTNEVTSASSTTFGVGGSGAVSSNGNNHIAYCFHSVAGYSKMGSYTGTGASGNTVTTGFKPAFVMVKRTDSANNWMVLDSTRDVTTDKDDLLVPNSSAAEVENSNDFRAEFTSTGFTLKTGYDASNGSGGSYIYMAFADTREAAFWLDDSGNNNDWENNGLTESDISLDSPTNNFATLNPLDKDASCTLSEGNLKYSAVATGYRNVRSSAFVGTGKWYAEFCPTTLTYESRVGFGIAQSDAYLTQVIGNTSTSYNVYWQYTNTAITKRNNSTDTNLTSTGNLQVNDVIQIAVDFDAGKIWWGWNGTWLDSGNPSSGINPIFSGIASGDYAFMFSGYTDGAGIANFGQDSSFAGNKTPQGYTDANGYGDFYYAPPAGYLALCTANLPEPAIGPNSATTADENFNTLAYSGTEGTDSKTGVGFQPDFTWIKGRSGAYGHCLYDAVRGATNQLATNSTGAEATNPANGILTSFDSDGFSLSAGSSSDLNVNDGSNSYVSWNWKADGSGSTNTDGTITSTVSANVDAGFSIVSYTSNGVTGATVGHGLSSAPEMIICKNRTESPKDWRTYHVSLGNAQAINLNTTTAAFASTTSWDSTTPNSSVFTLGGASTVNSSTPANHIAYCFHSVEGYSKFGSYTGNGSTDGPFVYTGFKPAFVMTKMTSSAGNWRIHDEARSVYNPMNEILYPNLSDAEDVDNDIDFTSNGFKLRNNLAQENASGATMIYMAFAENPFKYSNAR